MDGPKRMQEEASKADNDNRRGNFCNLNEKKFNEKKYGNEYD